MTIFIIIVAAVIAALLGIIFWRDHRHNLEVITWRLIKDDMKRELAEAETNLRNLNITRQGDIQVHSHRETQLHQQIHDQLMAFQDQLKRADWVLCQYIGLETMGAGFRAFIESGDSCYLERSMAVDWLQSQNLSNEEIAQVLAKRKD